MAVSYTKLWKLLLDKKMKRTDLKGMAGISSSTLAKLGKDEYVSLESLDKICQALGLLFTCPCKTYCLFLQQSQIRARSWHQQAKKRFG